MRIVFGIAARFFLAICIIVAIIEGAKAHERWADNGPVPSWVKAACCGPEDVHHLTSAQVHAMADGWHVEGYPEPIAYSRTLPSEDGDYWIFYRRFQDGSVTPVYCFFAPAQGF